MKSRRFSLTLAALALLAGPLAADSYDIDKAHAEVGFGRGRLHRGGSYVCIEGPQFSTLAESQLYRSWGARVIGMTNMPEAALAREAELCYASVAMVTDYDSWRPAEEGANVADILEVMHGNSANARALVAAVAAAWAPSACPQGCDHALDHAIITDPALWPPPVVERLRGVAGRVLK